MSLLTLSFLLLVCYTESEGIKNILPKMLVAEIDGTLRDTKLCQREISSRCILSVFVITALPQCHASSVIAV